MKKGIITLIRWIVIIGVGIFSFMTFIDNPITRILVAFIYKYKSGYALIYLPRFILDIVLLDIFIVAALILKTYFSDNNTEEEDWYG